MFYEWEVVLLNCSHCGHPLRPGARFCNICGESVRPLPQVAQSVSPSAPAGGSLAASLVAADGRTFPLAAPLTIVGRTAGCNVVLPHDTVSSHHAEIITDGHTYAVRDLGSRNGTWVNGRKIATECPLSPGDRVAFGQVVCTFQEPGRSTQAIDETHLATMVGPQDPRTAVPPSPWGGPSPLTAPPPDELGVELRTWDKAPQAEGKVLDVTTPVMEKKGNMGGKVAAAVGLALIAAPLAWIPFAIDRNEVPVRFLRVQDTHTRRQVSVKMIGDPSGAITVGDVVAVWGVQADGDLVMQAAYNYTTGAQIRLRV